MLWYIWLILASQILLTTSPLFFQGQKLSHFVNSQLLCLLPIGIYIYGRGFLAMKSSFIIIHIMHQQSWATQCGYVLPVILLWFIQNHILILVTFMPFHWKLKLSRFLVFSLKWNTIHQIQDGHSLTLIFFSKNVY